MPQSSKQDNLISIDMTTQVVDGSGRVTLKQPQRELLGDKVILTYGDSTSMRMFTPEAFAENTAEILALLDSNRLDPDSDQIQRQMIDCKVTCKIDSQGRLRIPAGFLTRSGLADTKQPEVQILYRSQMGYWEIWPTKDVNKPPEPDDPFYQARRLLSDRARTHQAASSDDAAEDSS